MSLLLSVGTGMSVNGVRNQLRSPDDDGTPRTSGTTPSAVLGIVMIIVALLLAIVPFDPIRFGESDEATVRPETVPQDESLESTGSSAAPDASTTPAPEPPTEPPADNSCTPPVGESVSVRVAQGCITTTQTLTSRDGQLVVGYNGSSGPRAEITMRADDGTICHFTLLSADRLFLRSASRAYLLALTSVHPDGALVTVSEVDPALWPGYGGDDGCEVIEGASN
ncbi:MAG: hypothetical protein AAGD35_09755 [Actinomycetota bacterium]